MTNAWAELILYSATMYDLPKGKKEKRVIIPALLWQLVHYWSLSTLPAYFKNTDDENDDETSCCGRLQGFTGSVIDHRENIQTQNVHSSEMVKGHSLLRGVHSFGRCLGYLVSECEGMMRRMGQTQTVTGVDHLVVDSWFVRELLCYSVSMKAFNCWTWGLKRTTPKKKGSTMSLVPF